MPSDPTPHDASRREHLVGVDELARLLTEATAPVLLDVRWRLGDPPGAGAIRYARGHLPGARFLDLESALTMHTGDPRDGRHPLPDLTMLTVSLANLGVDAATPVVVYDEPGSFAAERAWWVLRWAGIRARLLDGGLSAWTASGHPFDALEPLVGGGLPTLTADEAGELPRHGTLLDARAPERFRGEVEPLDPRAGHIPGASNLPASSLYAGDGTLPDEGTLRELASTVVPVTDPGQPDEHPVGVYCGSGVSAARDVLAFATLGVPAALFSGSWSAWSSDPDRPVATGGGDGGVEVVHRNGG